MSAQVPRSRVRIAIVEDHTLFAESLELALSISGYDVRRVSVQDHSSASALLSQVLRTKPRIVMLDLDLGLLGDGVKLIEPLARSGAQVVVVTASLDRARWGECVRYGARTVVAKSRPLNETLATVRRLNNGLSVMDGAERDELLRQWHKTSHLRGEQRTRLDRLTPREQQILGYLMEGQTVTEIARTSVVSEATVRTQVKSILSKLEVSSQVAAVGLAHHAEWRAPHA